MKINKNIIYDVNMTSHEMKGLLDQLRNIPEQYRRDKEIKDFMNILGNALLKC